jgi:hypothetical protein
MDVRRPGVNPHHLRPLAVQSLQYRVEDLLTLPAVDVSLIISDTPSSPGANTRLLLAENGWLARAPKRMKQSDGAGDPHCETA